MSNNFDQYYNIQIFSKICNKQYRKINVPINHKHHIAEFGKMKIT